MRIILQTTIAMKTSIKFLALLFSISTLSIVANAQQVNSLYFMENNPMRHNLNPAFQPQTDYYISLPFLGSTQLNYGNNSLTIKDLIYNYNGQTVSFLHPTGGDLDKFYNTLKTTVDMNGEMHTNIVSLGMNYKKAYWSFSISEKNEGRMGLPKDFFRLSLYGASDINTKVFDFKSMENDITAYTEFAFGYSKKLDDKWTVGGKVKLLMGLSAITNTNNELNLNIGADNWNLKGSGIANIACPAQICVTNNFKSMTLLFPSSDINWLKPSGMGAGIDFGVNYKLNEDFNLSASLTDFGFIRWGGNIQNIDYNVDYSFDGVGKVDKGANFNTVLDVFNKMISGNSLVDSLSKAFESSANLKYNSNSFITSTTGKINIGAEYKMYDNHLSVGLISRTLLLKNSLSEEITVSLNARPTQKFNATFSYSLFNGHLSTFGAAIGIKTGFVHWFISGDYIPFQKTSLSLKDVNNTLPDFKIPIPTNSKNFNLALGLNIVFNNKTKDLGLIKKSYGVKKEFVNYKIKRSAKGKPRDMFSGLYGAKM